LQIKLDYLKNIFEDQNNLIAISIHLEKKEITRYTSGDQNGDLSKPKYSA
jgi:hypothetical protein